MLRILLPYLPFVLILVGGVGSSAAGGHLGWAVFLALFGTLGIAWDVWDSWDVLLRQREVGIWRAQKS